MGRRIFLFLAEASLERVYGRVRTWFLGWLLVVNRNIIVPSLYCMNMQKGGPAIIESYFLPEISGYSVC